MNAISSYLINAGIFFLLIFLSGYLLTHLGKPYNMLIITIHKLLGLAIGIYLGVSLYRINQMDEISTLGIGIIAITVVFFLAMVASGSLLSAERTFPNIIKLMHRSFPYLTVLSTGILIFLVL
jgi:hypothetical protein